MKSCPMLYDPMDCSPSGPSVHGVLLEKILEWVAISASAMPSLFIYKMRMLGGWIKMVE